MKAGPFAGSLRRPDETLSDAQAGVTLGLESVPDGMASAVLSGVDPVFGLHAAMVSLIVGGLRTSTELMSVTTTSAMAVAVGAALGPLAGQARIDALFLLTLLIGGMMLLFGLLRLGALVRFLSHEAMAGFLTGIGVLIIFSQIPTIIGVGTGESHVILAGVDGLLHIGQADPATLFVGIGTIAMILLLGRTRMKNLSMVASVVAMSALAAVLGTGVPAVADIGSIGSVLPSPVLPDLSLLTPDLVAWAFFISIVGLAQGAGIAQTSPNQRGKRSEPSRDFTAQGMANIASGFLQGMPTGGSISASVLVKAAGARTRLANILAGVSILLMLLFLGQWVLQLALPALAGLLVVAGMQVIRPDRLVKIWRTNYEARTVMVLTFAATIVLPIIYAIIASVLLSAILFVYKSSLQVRVIEVVPLPGGSFSERRAPTHLPSEKVTILDFHGSLFYAGAWTVERHLPRPEGSYRAVVVLRLHGHTEIGSTFVEVMERYSRALRESGGRLMVAGAGRHVMRQLERTGTIGGLGRENIFPEGEVLEDAIFAAFKTGQRWIEERGKG